MVSIHCLLGCSRLAVLAHSCSYISPPTMHTCIIDLVEAHAKVQSDHLFTSIIISVKRKSIMVISFTSTIIIHNYRFNNFQFGDPTTLMCLLYKISSDLTQIHFVDPDNLAQQPVGTYALCWVDSQPFWLPSPADPATQHTLPSDLHVIESMNLSVIVEVLQCPRCHATSPHCKLWVRIARGTSDQHSSWERSALL